jgi:homoserine dehydrogenase
MGDGEAIKVGLLGRGTVGGAFAELIDQRADAIAELTGKRPELGGVLTTSSGDFDQILEESDVIVELIGGLDPARDYVLRALQAGKPVISANKALIAEHGIEIAELAERHNAHLLFEAAVAGAIPIVRAIRNSLSGVIVQRVSGILNGTCNYILSEMLRTGAAYETVLADAQRLGYAESDPYLDVSGMDAAHKVLILASIAYGARPDFSQVQVEGVGAIEAMDITLANKFDYRIKLVAEAFRANGGVRCRVAPVLVQKDHPLAQVNGPLNAVVVEGEPVGRLTFTGPGAGAGPTAAAVMGDLARLFEGPATPPLGKPAKELAALITTAKGQADQGSFFIGAKLADKPGVFAALTEQLAEAGVSIDKLIQDSAGDTGAAPVAIMTHPCPRASVEKALAKVAELKITTDKPRLLRIETRA